MGPCGGDPAHRVVHAQAYTTHLNPPCDLESRRNANMEGKQSATQSSRPLACTVQQPATDHSKQKQLFWKRERTQAQQKSAWMMSTTRVVKPAACAASPRRRGMCSRHAACCIAKCGCIAAASRSGVNRTFQNLQPYTYLFMPRCATRPHPSTTSTHSLH